MDLDELLGGSGLPAVEVDVDAAWSSVHARAVHRPVRPNRRTGVAVVAVVSVFVVGMLIAVRPWESDVQVSTGPGAGQPGPCAAGPRFAIDRVLEEHGLTETVLYGDGEPRPLIEGAVTTEPAFSPDGTQVAYVKADGDYESAGPASTEIWTVEVGGGTPQLLVPAEPLATSPDWSPDGRSIVYASRGDVADELRSVDVLTREVSTILRLDSVAISRPEWSPDGSQVAFLVREFDPATAAHTTTLATVEADGSGHRVVAEVPDAQWLSWGPEPTAVLVSTLGGEQEAVLSVDVADGTATEVASGSTMAEWGLDGEILYREHTAEGWRVALGRLEEGHISRTEVIDPETIFAYPQLGLALRYCQQ